MWLRFGIVGNLLRAFLAVTVLVLCVQDWPAAQASRTLAELPAIDYAGRARALHADGHEQAAMLVIEEGLRRHSQATDTRAGLLALRAEMRRHATDWQAPVKAAVHGAWSGQAEDAPGLVGAVVADLLVFGDVRDLAVQSSRGLQGQSVDPVLVSLSLAGIALTAVPAADGGTALLKAARRSGAISASMGKHLITLSRKAWRNGDVAPLRRVINDATALTHATGVRPAQRLLRGMHHPKQLHQAVRLARRPGGAYTLWAGGPALLRWVGPDAGYASDMALIAARKGEAGVRHLLRHGRVLARPHPLIGVMKGIYKGHFLALSSHFLRRHAALIAGLAAGWLLFEMGHLALRLRGRQRKAVQKGFQI